MPFFSKKIQEDTLLNIPAGYLNTSAVFIDILYGKGGEKDTQIRTNYDIMEGESWKNKRIKI